MGTQDATMVILIIIQNLKIDSSCLSSGNLISIVISFAITQNGLFNLKSFEL